MNFNVKYKGYFWDVMPENEWFIDRDGPLIRREDHIYFYDFADNLNDAFASETHVLEDTVLYTRLGDLFSPSSQQTSNQKLRQRLKKEARL